MITLSQDHLPITWVMHQSHELMAILSVIQLLLPTVLGAGGMCVSQPGRVPVSSSSACAFQALPEALVPPFEMK